MCQKPDAPVIDAPATILQYRRMQKEQREDFERRLLALVRNQMDAWDERFPDGWEITDFVVTARGYVPPEPGASVDPWAGGPYPGWLMAAWTRGSSTTWQGDIELLQDALDYTTGKHLSADRDDEDEEDEENEES
jgi:hypothetical protein